MIPKECKRLAEVDFPIAVVSKHSAREKSIRHGHPSTLHLWWARRPLAACRSMLLALLLPDPCDPKCPAEFKAKARALLPIAPGHNTAKLTALLKTDEGLRTALLAFIGDFANWDNAGVAGYLDVSRGLVKAAHPEETPLVVDPFAGGGSIPLEALRLGCDAFASDLNPVACLINKVLLEDIPRRGAELAEELRKVGAEVKKVAEKELAEFYPRDPDGARPIAYLWARTVRCEQAGCGSEIPLIRSFWICSKKDRYFALRVRDESKLKPGDSVSFEVFQPKTEKEVRIGTIANGKATCVCCKKAVLPARIRAQITSQRGGGRIEFDTTGNRIDGPVLIAVATLNGRQGGRGYRSPNAADYQALWKASLRVNLGTIPDEAINPTRPSPNARGLSAITRYGLTTFGHLYTIRQTHALATLARIVASEAKGAVKTLLALAVGRVANAWTCVSRWDQTRETVVGAFNGQKIAMVWDFAEAAPFSGASGGWENALEWIVHVTQNAVSSTSTGQVQQSDAAQPVLPEDSVAVWFTDPPYYDSVPYADLSDFFLVWLKQTLPELATPDPYDLNNKLSPKTQECVWNQSHRDETGTQKSRGSFEAKFAQVASANRQTLREDGVGCVVFAHKSTDGWEALLSGLISRGFFITASWPIVTEMAQRNNARGTASLMGSVHLVCRPRAEDAPIGDWAQVLRELPRRVADWMHRLQDEGVRGADLVFACIGPALEVYSRYSQVVDAEEREIPLGGNPEASEPHERGFLAYVWEVVGRAALEQVLGTSGTQTAALEEDARLTALFLWTLQTTDMEADKADTDEDDDAEEDESDDEEETASTSKKKKKGFSLPFDVVRRFAQPLGIHLDAWAGRCLETEKGIVRLIPVLDRAEQLFGEDGADAVAEKLEKHKGGPVQGYLPGMEPDVPPERAVVKGGRKRKGSGTVSDESLQHRGATTLDHVHAAMLLQSSGRANALRALLKSEIERGPDFLRLANALSALYPPGSDEKRLVDAMLLAVPR